MAGVGACIQGGIPRTSPSPLSWCTCNRHRPLAASRPCTPSNTPTTARTPQRTAAVDLYLFCPLSPPCHTYLARTCTASYSVSSRVPIATARVSLARQQARTTLFIATRTAPRNAQHTPAPFARYLASTTCFCPSILNIPHILTRRSV